MLDSGKLWTRCEDQLRNLVRRDRNHPAVFGWSVANEVIPVIKHVRRQPPAVVEAMCQRYGRWVELVKSVDPSRSWISADGDGDGDGRLPTLVGHYGDLNSMRDWSRKGKPWGIGEQTMAYYGTPRQVAKINGDRAYESMEGRMEGLAYEAYHLIANGQRKYGASYCSIFNLVWYALQPLEFGLPDTSRPYTLEDGVFFGPYVEGRFGVQPERLGPYCITLNAGYDPSLPLYRTWPLFDAVKAAYAPQGAETCKWDKMPVVPEPLVIPLPTGNVDSATFLGVEGGGTLKLLQLMGVKLEDQKPGVIPQFLLVDGAQLPEKEFEQKHAKLAKADAAGTPSPQEMIDQTLAQGGTVLVWNPCVRTLDYLNSVLPERLELTDRETSSLLVKQADPLVASLTAADLYFSELNPNLIMQVGLAGPLVDKGRVLLEACNTDWRAWNKQGENVKTAMILRSEREAKPCGAALVVLPVGKGRLVVSSLVGLADSKERLALGRRLLANMGLKLSEPANQVVGGLFSDKGFLVQALVCGSFPAETLEVGGQTDYLKGQATIRPRAGDKTGGRDWNKVEAQDGRLFDFKKMNLPGPKEKAVVYLSFWLHSPRPLDDLLIEPDIPKVDMLLGSDDGIQVWLNGKKLLEDINVHPAVIGQKQCSALPLKRGWSHVLVKVIQGSGNWQFGAQLQCDKPGFLAELRSALESPAE
jgi:beta-galactosidase